MSVTWSDKSGTKLPTISQKALLLLLCPSSAPKSYGQLPQRYKQQHLPKPVYNGLKTYSSYKDRIDTKIMEENSERDNHSHKT